MAFREDLAERVRRTLTGTASVKEIKMFGGLCFTVRGHMCCGVLNDDLVVRVSPERYQKVLAEPHARPMDFTGRPLKGFVFVGPEGCKTEASLRKWIGRSADFIAGLPAKKPRSASRKRGTARRNPVH